MNVETVVKIAGLWIEIPDPSVAEVARAVVEYHVPRSQVEAAVSEAVKHFVEKGYSPDEVEAEVKYEVLVRDDGMFNYEVEVFARPSRHPEVVVWKKVKEGLENYVSSEFTKERNEIGRLLKAKTEPYFEIIKKLKQ
jgi:hypothetical protein